VKKMGRAVRKGWEKKNSALQIERKVQELANGGVTQTTEKGGSPTREVWVD